jgi:2-oxo-3-hexenedioate decarboxylase
VRSCCRAVLGAVASERFAEKVRWQEMAIRVEDPAEEALWVLGAGCQISPFTARYPSFGVEDVYRVTAVLMTEWRKRGGRIIGRKIGVANQTIWAEYNVHVPMWGYPYNRTVHDLPPGGVDVALTAFAEPSIEPEIIFAVRAATAAGINVGTPIERIEWDAPGFKIVKSILAGWRFGAPGHNSCVWPSWRSLDGATASGRLHRSL